jgi:monoterpene epsilon-lactone hydrolase
MPSLQSRLFSLFFRLYFKRRPPADDAAYVRLARAKFDPPEFLRKPVPAGAQITPVHEGGIRGEWVAWRGQSAQPMTVLYLHGGGYVGCSPVTHRQFTVALARTAQARIFAPDYRLAPEHQFPAAVEDAVQAYRWLLAQGVEPQKLVIGGDSAGGGLTISTLVALRDAGLPLPKAAFAFSPWTDMAATGASLQRNEATDSMFYAASVQRCAHFYLGEASPQTPLASPLYADLHGLPPLRIYVSGSEILLDDSVRLAERARADGVAVELQIRDGLIHVWPIFYGMFPEAAETLDELAVFLQRQLNLP